VAVFAHRWLSRLSRHWLLAAGLLWGVYVGLPWLAPVLMKVGWTGGGDAIYLLYATQCHQLPQRSFFLFGPQAMYSLAEIQAAWQATDNPLVLRQLVGSAEMGWKVAWSDRMVAMWTSLFVAGALFWPLRRRARPLPLWAFVLLTAPLALDGGTHLLSDLTGLGQGFRDTNAWLAVLTQHAFSPAFYAGEALGSFNSWMRLATGVLFGVGVVWLAFPYLEAAFADLARQMEAKLPGALISET
jgi:uncharacterized membrane protein